ncbi:hypothetical protein Tco_0994712 [Tanacetum coccineum]
MTTLLFAVTHNLVVFLDKPAESEGFEQIVDFLNASSIRYALTVNPTIYTSCIQQFWATVKVKTVNGKDLQLEDAEGIDSLPNAAIFEQLTLIGYEKLSQKLTFYKAFCSFQWKFLIHTILQCLSVKTTTWNEFSSTMASAIIYLATNQKFNFSKYIFDSMVKNVDNVNKFLMYPRFEQMFVNQQAGDMSNHKRIYVTPSYTKKVFGNIKREGKGFSGRVTPLFPTMMVQAQQEQGEGSANTTDPQHTPTITQPSVLDLEHTKTNQALEIDNLKRRVKKLEKKQRSRTYELRRLYKVGLSARFISSKDEGLGEEDASKPGRKIHDIDADEDITLDSTHFDTDLDMFGVHDLDGDEVFVETEEPVVNVATTASTIPVSVAKDFSDIDITLAQALAELKNAKPKTVTTAATTTTTTVTRPKAKGIAIQEQKQASTPITSSKDKGKGIMVEEPLKMKKKDQEKVETDYELAQRLQAEEQEELIIEEKSKLFQQLLEKRRKHFAAKRAEERRNRPPTKSQQRSIMCTYLKNIAGWKPTDLKTNEVRAEGSETITQESSLKRAGDELEQDKSKKQKLDEKVEVEVDDAKEPELVEDILKKIKIPKDMILEDKDEVY